MLKKILVVSLLIIAASGLSYSQSNYKTKAEKLQQLKIREDISQRDGFPKVTEVEKDVLKLEYPNGKVLYKNIGDYQPESSSLQKLTYSPTFDSTIIDLTTIDTTLYYQMYSFWQEVPIFNWEFDHIRIGDVNKNGKPELYGSRKFFSTPLEPVTVYELNDVDNFEYKFQYDSTLISRNVYDVDRDGKEDVQLGMGGTWGIEPSERFFSKPTDTSLAAILNFEFIPVDRSDLDDSTFQVNDAKLGDYDKDGITDFLSAAGAGRGRMHIFEYNAATNSFDSVYRYQIVEPNQLEVSGFSVGDFDLDGKTDIVFGTGSGKVHVVENQGNNQYTHVWLGEVESYHAYIHTWTNDIDGNGKPEFWVLADAYYNGIGTTRITIFETNGDNSYQAVGRVDLVGVFSFYAGTLQAVDIDNDGTEEIAVCIDGNFLIIKFNGSRDHQTYGLYYIKKNETYPEGEWTTYFGALVNDLLDNGQFEILISMSHSIEVYPPIYNLSRAVTKIYKNDSTTNVSADFLLPDENKLYQNYPSPFNPSTNIKFALNEFNRVSIKIYNILGKEITTLLEKELTPGSYTISWEARDSNGQLLPSGVYFIRFTANGGADNYTKTIKTILMK